MGSNLGLWVVVSTLLLASEVRPTKGLDVQGDPGSYFGSAVISGDESFADRHPRVYNVYLEPAERRDFEFGKRSRLFVGKRFGPDTPLDQGEDYIVLPSEENTGLPFTGNDLKRNHLFVGKRGSPKFVGKRSLAGLLRKKRFAPSETEVGLEFVRGQEGGPTELQDEHAWKLWMEREEEDGSGPEKRSRLFVGKRRGFDSRRDEEEDKRSRLFVGKRGFEITNEADDKRSRLFVGKRLGFEATSDADDKRSRLFVGKRQGFEDTSEAEDKRSRLFVGRRAGSDENVPDGSGVSSGSVVAAESQPVEEKKSRLFVGKRPLPPGEADDKLRIHQTQTTSGEDDKRGHLFPGKRPAPGFVGKREVK